MKGRTKSALSMLGSSALFMALGVVSVVCGAGNAAAETASVPVLTAGLSTSTWIGIAIGAILVFEIIIWLFLRWLRNKYY